MQINLSDEQIKKIIKGALYIAESLDICEKEVLDLLKTNGNITRDEAFIMRNSDYCELNAADI